MDDTESSCGDTVTAWTANNAVRWTTNRHDPHGACIRYYNTSPGGRWGAVGAKAHDSCTNGLCLPCAREQGSILLDTTCICTRTLCLAVWCCTKVTETLKGMWNSMLRYYLYYYVVKTFQLTLINAKQEGLLIYTIKICRCLRDQAIMI